jgi:hypothetical protein
MSCGKQKGKNIKNEKYERHNSGTLDNMPVYAALNYSACSDPT